VRCPCGKRQGLDADRCQATQGPHPVASCKPPRPVVRYKTSWLNAMPLEAVATESTPTEDFSSWRSKPSGERGSAAAPADVDVKVEVPGDTDSNSSAADGKPESKTADDSEPSPQGKVEKRKSEIQREIDDLVRKREELKREVSGKPPETVAQIPSATATAAFDGVDPKDPEPKFPDHKDAKYGGADGFELYERDKLRYATELAKWEMRRDTRAENFKANQAETERNHKERLDEFEARGSEFAAEHEDYPELVDKFKKMVISNELGAVLLSADNGPAMLYDLMTDNVKELKRIESMKLPIDRLTAYFELKYKSMSAEQLREVFPQLGDADDTRPPADNKPKASAPKPGTRVNGSGGGGSKEPSSFAAYRKSRFA
jgi:hypothetical protein